MKAKLTDDPHAVAVKGPRGTAIFIPWGPNQGYYTRRNGQPHPMFRQLFNIGASWTVEPITPSPATTKSGRKTVSFDLTGFGYAMMSVTGREDRYINVVLKAAIEKIPEWARDAVRQLPPDFRLLGLSWLNYVGPDGLQRLLTAPGYCLALLSVASCAQRKRLGYFAAMSRKEAIHKMAPKRIPADVRQALLALANDPEKQAATAGLKSNLLYAAWISARVPSLRGTTERFGHSTYLFEHIRWLSTFLRPYRLPVTPIFRPAGPDGYVKYLEDLCDTLRLIKQMNPPTERAMLERALYSTPAALDRYHRHLIMRGRAKAAVTSSPTASPAIEDGPLALWALSSGDLAEESARMVNCVVGYHAEVQAGSLKVYHVRYKDEHATLGVAGDRLHQLYGRHNVDCSPDLWNAVAAHIPAVAATLREAESSRHV